MLLQLQPTARRPQMLKAAISFASSRSARPQYGSSSTFPTHPASLPLIFPRFSPHVPGGSTVHLAGRARHVLQSLRVPVSRPGGSATGHGGVSREAQSG